MHRSTLVLLLASAFHFVSAAPSPLVRSRDSTLSQRGIGEEAERRLWRRQLASSVNGMSWSLVETGSTTATSSATTTPTESSTISTTEPASSSSSSVASSSSTSSPASSTSASSSSSSPLKNRSSLSSTSSSGPSSSTAAIHSSLPTPKIEAAQSGNIFSPSNKLFAVGIVVIIAIIVLSIFIFIFTIKRILHSKRFIDPLDYPEGEYHTAVLSKRYSSTSDDHRILDPVQLSPNSSMESYDSTEKGEIKSEMEFATYGSRGTNPISRPPPSSALPPLPLPPAPVARTQPLPFSNLQSLTPQPTPRTRTRAPPPPALEIPSSSFSAPAFDNKVNSSTQNATSVLHRPRPVVKSDNSPRNHRPSYISTLPLSPNSKTPVHRIPHPSSNTPPAPPSKTTPSRTMGQPPSTRPPTSSIPHDRYTSSAPRRSSFVPAPRPTPTSVSTSSNRPGVVSGTTRIATRHNFSPPKGRESPLREEAKGSIASSRSGGGLRR
ncbi:hypothetical protein JCM16303_005023 [Sporobolomyces ruberrimus]